jgi:hypothetical protein
MKQKFLYPGKFKDYAGDLAGTVSTTHSHSTFKEVLLQKTEQVLGDHISLPLLRDQLNRSPVISTADHHSLLNYRLLYNSNLLFAEIIKTLKLPFVVVPASGNIPLINKSYPRGFYFKERKFNFFTERKSKVPLFLFDLKLSVNRDEGLKSFILNSGDGVLTEEEEKFLEFLFFECLEIEQVARSQETFPDQLSLMNYKLWKYYFDQSIRGTIPDLIYLQATPVFIRSLIEEIKNDESLVSLFLFEPSVREVFLKHFNGIYGAWDDTKGTHFFWGISEKKRFTELRIDSSLNSLVGENMCFPLEREAIIDALSNNKIISGLFLDYLIVTFLGGLVTVGGFNQLEYLPQMQQAHIKCLKEIGMNDLSEQFASRTTNGLVCGMFPFAFDSGIDLIWHYNSTNGKFNGNLDRGLTQDDLDNMLNTKLKDMIASAIETMLENISPAV